MDSPRTTLSGIVLSPCSVAEDGVMNRNRIAVDLAKSAGGTASIGRISFGI